MLANPMDVLHQFPVRKSKKQKQAFRDAVQGYAEHLGYSVSVEKGSFGSQNVIMGDPKSAAYLITAHYDTPATMLIPNMLTPCNLLTYLLYQFILVLVFFLIGIAFGAVEWLALCLIHLPFAESMEMFLVSLGYGLVALLPLGWLNMMLVSVLVLLGPANKRNSNDNTSGVVTVLEMMRTMPENQRHKVCFVLFDLEEAGLIGSSSYRKAHKKETDHQIVLNLDCVGDGDEIVFFPTKKLRKDGKKLAWLYKAIGRYGEKTIDVREKGFAFYPSDQTQFPLGVGIAAFHRSKWAGLYLGRIHTPKDTVLEITNVNVLRACLTTLVTGGE